MEKTKYTKIEDRRVGEDTGRYLKAFDKIIWAESEVMFAYMTDYGDEDGQKLYESEGLAELFKQVKNIVGGQVMRNIENNLGCKTSKEL